MLHRDKGIPYLLPPDPTADFDPALQPWACMKRHQRYKTLHHFLHTPRAVAPTFTNTVLPRPYGRSDSMADPTPNNPPEASSLTAAGGTARCDQAALMMSCGVSMQAAYTTTTCDKSGIRRAGCRMSSTAGSSALAPTALRAIDLLHGSNRKTCLSSTRNLRRASQAPSSCHGRRAPRTGAPWPSKRNKPPRPVSTGRGRATRTGRQAYL